MVTNCTNREPNFQFRRDSLKLRKAEATGILAYRIDGIIPDIRNTTRQTKTIIKRVLSEKSALIETPNISSILLWNKKIKKNR